MKCILQDAHYLFLGQENEVKSSQVKSSQVKSSQDVDNKRKLLGQILRLHSDNMKCILQDAHYLCLRTGK